MIGVENESEFTVTIADVIKTLDKLDDFIVRVWISSNELPIEFSNDDDVLFMQESVKIVTNQTVKYIFYDIITGLEIEYDNFKELAIGYG